MPEISLTEDQHEQLMQVREDLEEAFLDDYGYIPLEDVVEYLLDTYTPPEERDAVDAYERLATAEYPQLQRVASEVPDVPGSGIDADEMRGRLLAELGVERFAARLAQTADGSTETDPGSGGTSPTGPASDDAGEPSGSSDPNEGATGADPGDGERGDTSAGASNEEPAPATDDGGEDSATPSTGGVSLGGGGGDPLAAANQMLREHDDKWREGSDEPYEVDLPDGRTESARTRDDVRQLLFRHYGA
jgi:hypothetical protein